MNILNFDPEILPNDWSEFDKRYLKTYVFLEFSKKENSGVYYYNGISPDQQDKLLFKNDKVGQIAIHNTDNTLTNFKPIFPKTGYKNHPTNKTALFICKKPDRQWKRSACYSNIQLNVVVNNILELNYPYIHKGNQGFISEFWFYLFQPEIYPTFKETLNNIQKEEFNYKPKLTAIAERYALSIPLLKSQPYPLLWNHRIPIGIVKDYHNIEPIHPAFNTEIRDFLNAQKT